MTSDDQAAYRAAWAAQAKIAAQRRMAIKHVIWRDGHMTCLMDRPLPPEPAPEPISSSRGVVQGSLL